MKKMKIVCLMSVDVQLYYCGCVLSSIYVWYDNNTGGGTFSIFRPKIQFSENFWKSSLGLWGVKINKFFGEKIFFDFMPN